MDSALVQRDRLTGAYATVGPQTVVAGSALMGNGRWGTSLGLLPRDEIRRLLRLPLGLSALLALRVLGLATATASSAASSEASKTVTDSHDCDLVSPPLVPGT